VVREVRRTGVTARVTAILAKRGTECCDQLKQQLCVTINSLESLTEQHFA
jgi:hypothetical protein